ncbi:MauE/DoxX family redox-associated membrane protein [Pseudotenacibaculum sp. MALMAid0570]|uniref:MauE/DoxX family redox-associated membrane protein n=1 Tax=Pseudotenacibaculum sp. MALMAid0570 TaxID=3143938 RepID=UPI0032DED752
MKLELQLTNHQKLNWVRIAALASTLVLMLYAPKLWLSSKSFPVVPLFEWIPIPIGVLEYIFWGLFFGSQLIYIFINKRWIGWFVVLLYVYLSLVDQNRLQPYFYQSALTILAIVIFPSKTETKKVLYAVILIFFATYFWSGIQKLNEAFYIQWLSAINKHFSWLPQWFLKSFTYAVPWLEASMGVLLLFNRTRTFAITFILGMHAIIVGLLFYLGYGYNVVPWNFQNMISVVVLFYGLKTVSSHEFFTYQFDKQKVLVLVFTMLLPIANNLFGYYDNLLSFHFFTADLSYYNVIIHEDLEEKLPQDAKDFYRYYEGQTYININEWAQYDNKVLFYPEKRAIHFIDAYLRSFADNPNQENLTQLIDYNKVTD